MSPFHLSHTHTALLPYDPLDVTMRLDAPRRPAPTFNHNLFVHFDDAFVGRGAPPTPPPFSRPALDPLLFGSPRRAETHSTRAMTCALHHTQQQKYAMAGVAGAALVGAAVVVLTPLVTPVLFWCALGVVSAIAVGAGLYIGHQKQQAAEARAIANLSRAYAEMQAAAESPEEASLSSQRFENILSEEMTRATAGWRVDARIKQAAEEYTALFNETFGSHPQPA